VVSVIIGLALLLIGLVGFAEAYRWAAQFSQDPMFAAALVNAVLCPFILIWFTFRQRKVSGWVADIISHRQILVGLALYGLAITVLPIMTALCGEAEVVSVDFNPWLAVVLVPIVEEVVFRMGVGSLIRWRWNGWVGYYVSALFFSVLHTSPTMDRVLALKVGVALGPFLLGLFCEFLFKVTGRLFFPIIFHCICNASVYIFSYFDARWLGWFSVFYL